MWIHITNHTSMFSLLKIQAEFVIWNMKDCNILVIAALNRRVWNVLAYATVDNGLSWIP